MIQMYPKAVVLTNRHPFGGTEMMAQSLASALDANGDDSHIVSIDDQTFHGLSALLKDPQLALVMTTGTLPLQVAVGGVPIWRALAPGVQFYHLRHRCLAATRSGSRRAVSSWVTGPGCRISIWPRSRPTTRA
jgi:hypothetical protein